MNIRLIAIICIGIAILILMALWFIFKRNSRNADPFEDMYGDEFEEYCKEMLERQGYEEVVLTPKSHDYGIDIFADKDGISYAIQCKCYSDTVGIKAVQEAYAGKDYYDCMVGVVMTNQNISKPAREFAQKLNVLLWDGDYMEGLIRDYGSPTRYKAIRDISNMENKKV